VSVLRLPRLDETKAENDAEGQSKMRYGEIMPEQIQLPPQVQQLLLQLQTFQQQMQAVALQKENMNLQKIEMEKALEELEKSDDEVFKAVGPILVKTTKADMIKELKEKNETIDLRLSSLNKQEEKIKEKINENQEKLQSFLKSAETGAAE